MDVLESVLYRLREHDDRAVTVRLRAVRHDLNLLDSAVVDQRAHRGAAAHLVVEALAVLASAGGLASDVAAAAAERLGEPGAAGHGRIYPGMVHDTTDQPDPRVGIACPVPGPHVPGSAAACPGADGRAAGAPDRYPDGPAGDRVAFLDLEHADDD